VIVVRLREMIRAYEEQTGERLTYAQLAERSGVARATVESLASRNGYNATLDTIDKLCIALKCRLTDLVHQESEPKRSADKPRGRKKR
jgi:putative transcriptional regulator